MFRRITQFSTLAVMVVSLGGYGVSYAQGDDDPCGDNPCGEAGDDGGGGGGSSGEGSSASSDGGSSDMPGPFSWGTGTKGIAVTFPTGGAGVASHIHFLDDKTQLRLGVGFNLTRSAGDDTAMPPIPSDTVIGLSLGAGYRMYKGKSGAIRPYMQPTVTFAVTDFGEFADQMFLAAGAEIGGEWMYNDQFSLGVGTGGGLSFADKFKTIKLGLFTTSITASFYWN